MSSGISGPLPRVTRPLMPGIIAPLPTFFLPESEDLGVFSPLPRMNSIVLKLLVNVDLDALEKHVVFLARAGVRPLLAGTMGEGLHLVHGERTKIIQSARKALDAAGFSNTPLIVGAGGGSTRETVVFCEEVAAAGADAAIVITPGYFAGVLANHRRALKEFFVEVAERSPVPVLIYNCALLVHPPPPFVHRSNTDPAASGGVDLDSDLIVELASACPNLFGVKLTCVDFD
jgi:4-hydroxy-2-oxoglutarate aldolase